MLIELTDEEAELLRTVIQRRITELGPEIHHTDSREYRKALKSEETKLTAIVQRLELAIVA